VASKPDGHQRKAPWETIENDNLVDENIQPFLERCFRALKAEALAPNAAWYLWHAHLTGAFFAAAAAAAADVLLHRQIIWKKPRFIIGMGLYHWAHEPAFMGWVRGNKPPFYGERNQTSVWEIDYDGKANPTDRIHPTQKPVELFKIPIRNHTKPGEICAEPFSGSGSQIIAAEQLGRRCFACEISPTFCAVSIQRWADLTGGKPERAEG
jgi:DNA modification methylase